MGIRSNNKLIDLQNNEFNLGMISDPNFACQNRFMSQIDSIFSYYLSQVGNVPNSSLNLPLPIINNQNGSDVYSVGLNRLPLTSNDQYFSNLK